MLKARSCVNLAAEAIGVDRCRDVGRKDLYDDLSIELELRRDEHARHAGAPQLAINAIGRAEDFLYLGG